MKKLDKSGRFSIKRVVEESGLSADTLRAWEDRYGLPDPQRSSAGHRLYSLYDIEVVKWMQKRKAEGIRPGQAARIFQDRVKGGNNPLRDSPAPIAEEVNKGRLDEMRARWLEACLRFDESGATIVLAQAFAQFTPVSVIKVILVEGMRRIGRGWLEGRISVAQEHFATQIVTRKLGQLSAALPPATRRESILVACPSGERHSLPGLLVAYLAGQAGWRAVFLGADLPLDEVAAIVKRSRIDAAVLAGTSLATAPAMARTLSSLQDLGVPAGYGGYVYSHNLALRDLMPGSYLGEDLEQVVRQLPALVLEPTSSPAGALVPMERFLTTFRMLRGQIAPMPQETLADEGTDNAKLDDLSISFFESIEAAAELGDFDLLAPELIWLDDYLGTRRSPNFSRQDFLSALGQAVQKTMGEEAQSLVAWLGEHSSPLITNNT